MKATETYRPIDGFQAGNFFNIKKTETPSGNHEVDLH